MKLLDAMFAWDRNGEVKVGPHPDTIGWSNGFSMTDGACWTHWRESNEDVREKNLFTIFHQMVVRDGVDPQTAHVAFLVIEEYRGLIASDIDGAAP